MRATPRQAQGSSMAHGMIALLLLLVSAMPALAAGTASQTSIVNGVFTPGDTVPQSAGKLSIAYKVSANTSDSRYSGFTSAGVTLTVDTGYDVASIGAPSDSRVSIGETASYAYWIKNAGNATLRIYFDSAGHPSSQGDSGPAASSTNWNFTGSYKVYTDSNDNGLWNTGDTIIGPYQGASNYIQLAAEASDTVVLVVVVPTDANDGETTAAFILVTNRAPVGNGSTTGDGWQDSVPYTSAERDTQYDTTVTTVVGPNVFVDKTMSEETSGRSRPGDTLIINITFDNDGGDTARGVEIMDAIPNNTRYVRNSADSGIYLGNRAQTATSYGDSDITVTFDTDAPGAELDFKDTEGHQSDTAPTTGARQAVRAIRWSLETSLGENNGDAKGTVNFNDGVYDNGRVAYRVVIQ